MKIIHLSDLHLGKKVNEFSMLEDQKYILNQIVTIIEKEKIEGVIIAGDIYDKPIPPSEAVQLFDEFLVQLSNRKLQVFTISGNHDSPERIAFGSKLMSPSGIHMAPIFEGVVEPIIVNDDYGKVNIYMLPFVKPVLVKKYFPEEKIESYTDAIQTVIEHMSINPNVRNILITHQFVTGASRCESEELSVGGTDNVDSLVFEPFDYVALGHIHSPQSIKNEYIRYSGTPLKYSFSEVKHQKSVTIVELKEKGNIKIKLLPLIPKHDMCEIKGSYMEISSKSFYEKINNEDYLHITLTDEEDIVDATRKLRIIYPNIMKLDYDNKRTQSSTIIEAEEMKNQSPLELFSELYQLQNNQSMTAEQQEFVQELIQKIWEEQI